MRLLRCLINDFRVQRRSGFWAVYAILCALYLAALFSLPPRLVPEAIVIILFMDPCALGFYFIGGFSYLERDDRTLSALLVSPLDWREHLVARVLSFTILALATSLIVAVPPIFVRGTDSFEVIPLVTGVSLGAIFFTLVGLLPATRFKTVNDYLIAAELWLIPFLPPFLARYGFIPDISLWRILPTDAVLDLLDLGVRGPRGEESSARFLFIPILIMIVWIGISWIVATRSFKRRMVECAGGAL